MRAVAFYMRLSSEDANVGESVSIANQRNLLYDFIQNHHEFDNCPVLEFCDDGYSGANFNRPSVQKLLSFAGKTIDCIIVKDISRFGRNLIEVGNYLDQIFPFLGVRFIAINERYDSQQYGSSINLDISLRAMIYEMYSRDISEKIRSVQQVKMQKGEYLCGIAFYGYKRSEKKKNRLEIDPTAAEVVRRIFNMAAKGVVPAKIAIKLNQDKIPSPLMHRKKNHTDKLRGWTTAREITYWTRENVRRIICDERYTGCLIGHKRTVVELSTKRTKSVPKEEWIVTRNTQEAIVSKEIFMQAQTVLKHNTSKKLPHKPYQKFHGLLKCAYCNRTLEHTVCKQNYFSCSTAKTVQNHICTLIHLEEEVLEMVLLRAIQTQVQLCQSTAIKIKGMEDYLQKEVKASQLVERRYRTLQAMIFEDYAEERINKEEYFFKKQKLIEKQKETKNYIFREKLTREILIDFVKEVRVGEKNILEIRWNFKEP